MIASPFNQVCVIGLGYIGLPTAAVIASNGIAVLGVDVNENAVNTVNSGKVHIVEPDLDQLVSKVVNAGNLRASLELEKSDVYVIAVPTPFVGFTKEPDLRFVQQSMNAIAPFLEPGNLIIIESTCPVGTTLEFSRSISELRSDLSFPHESGDESDVKIAYCPERVLPGMILAEIVENSRIIGGMSDQCSILAHRFYTNFVKGECIIASSASVAEMVKLAENSFRDVNIAFANELSTISHKLNVDVWEVIDLANRHPRVDILRPGAGVGGHCIAVDPWFLVSAARAEANLINTAREVNDGKVSWVVERVINAVEKITEDKITSKPLIACYGLAFKPDIDDLRESPAMKVVSNLLKKFESQIICVEPHIKQLPNDLNSAQLVSMEEASQIAVVHVFLVGHSVFKTIRFENNDDFGCVLDICGILR